MKKYRVAFCGTPQIAKGILETLNEMDNIEIIYSISQPDRPVGRKKELKPTPVKEYSLENNITCLQPEKVSEVYDKLKESDLDFIITCAFGQFIPTKILELPKIDALNIHGSLLPKYRGGAPIQYSIINGDKETGVSLMRMVKKMDAGPVFSQRVVKIDDLDDSGSLFIKVGEAAKLIIKEDLEKVANGSLKPIEQDESEVTFSYNITSEQEEIDWNKSKEEIHNLVRGLSPRPIAHTFVGEERYKIGKTRLIRKDEVFPITLMIHQNGEVVRIDEEGIIVQTKNGYIKILEIQRPGKKMMEASIYFTNRNLQDIRMGTRFKNDKTYKDFTSN